MFVLCVCMHVPGWCAWIQVCVCAWLPEGVYVMLSVVVACLSDCLVASVCLSKHTCLFQYALCARRVCVCLCVTARLANTSTLTGGGLQMVRD